MYYRRAQPEDFEHIVALQNANLSWNLSTQQKHQGFLSTAFTLEQFEEMDAGHGIAVCLKDSNLIGYLCAATVEFNRAFPLQSAMIQNLSTIFYQGKPLIAHRLSLTTPVCIDRQYRSQGIFLGLCSQLIELAGPQFDIATAFISAANERSLQACGKVMEVVGQFESHEQVFTVLIRDLKARPWEM